MKLFSTVFFFTLISTNAFSSIICADDLLVSSSMGSITLVGDRVNLKCYGTNFHDLEKKIKSEKKIIKNRLYANTEILKEYNLLLKEAKTVAVLKKSALMASKAMSSIFPAPLNLISGLTFLPLNINNDLDLSAVEKLAQVSPHMLVDTVEKDLLIFEDAHQKISVLENNLVSKYQEGKNQGLDDVHYLEVKIGAEKARNDLYKHELIYLQKMYRILKKECKK